VVGDEGSSWFATRPDSAVRDLFDVYARSRDGLEASERALEQAGGALPGGVARLSAGLHERLRRALDGDWRPYEQHLGTLGAAYARQGLAIAAWYEISNELSGVVVARAVDAFAAQPARLTAVLRVHGELIARSLALIAGGYYAVKEQREHEVTARHQRMIEAALDAVIEIDEHGVVTEFNPAAERTFGYPRDAALGRSLAQQSARDVDGLKLIGIADVDIEVHRFGPRAEVVLDNLRHEPSVRRWSRCIQLLPKI